ncbi:MAG TPA: aldehyde dehydrogenase family protein, partial [Terriglobales bacterium]|nr:aldehyde dehydrogenase family protein [Terriglobales bacterium]
MATDLQIGTRNIISANPATGDILREIECMSEPQVQETVARTRAAQPAWNELGVSKRLKILKTFQRLLNENKSEVARLITSETGKPYAEALTTEVIVVLDAVRFCLENVYEFL